MEIETKQNIENPILFESKEGIKLTRNASQIYQWEIKTFNLNAEEVLKIDDEIRDALDKRNLKYIKEDKKNVSN